MAEGQAPTPKPRKNKPRAAHTSQVSSEPCAAAGIAATHGDGLMAEGSAFNKPKPKSRSLHKLPQGKRTSDDPLLLCKALKLHETRLINALLYHSHLSVPKVVKIAQDNELVCPGLLDRFEFLDPSVPQKLRCRYLIQNIYKSLTAKTCTGWLRALSTVEGSGSVLPLVRQCYSRLLNGNLSPGEEDEKGRNETFEEFHIPILAEILAGCSSRWEEIATAFWLSRNKIENIRAMRCTPELLLKEAISSWILCECKEAKLPMLVVLEEVLRSELVGLGTRANKIAAEFREKTCSVVQPETVQDTDSVQSFNKFTVKEGTYVLLEAQGEGDQFEWHGCDNSDANCYFDTEERIVCVLVKELTAEGNYTCKITDGGRTSFLEPICVAVTTPLDDYQKFLRDRYTAQPEVPEDTWPPESTGTFISLALIKQQTGEYARSTIRGDMDDIYSDKESISYDEAMGGLSSGARLLIEGRPGSGKTTLVHKFSLDWTRKDFSINHVRLLFFIHLRFFFSDPNIGLRDVINCHYKDHPGMEIILSYAIEHNGLGLCFVLDGLDEYLPQENSFIYKLIKKLVLPRAIVIVASRPAAASAFRSVATRQIEVLGFLKPQIDNYIQRYPFSENSKCEGLRRYFEMHPNIHHMCYLPIHACMICFLYDHVSTELPETETEVYREFTKSAMLRILYRDSHQAVPSLVNFTDLPPVQMDQYLKICKLGYEMTLSSKQVIRQGEVRHFFAGMEENQLFGLITVDKMAMICGYQELYTFLHLTFQEFLAAYHIYSLEKGEQMEIIKMYGSEPQMKQVWKFYCGLAQPCDEVFRLLIKIAQRTTLFNIQCSFESQRPSTCDSVVVNNSLGFHYFYGTFLTPSDFTAIAYVISNTKRRPVNEILFNNCAFGMDGVDVLVNKAPATKLSLLTTLRCYLAGVNETVAFSYCLKCLTNVGEVTIRHGKLENHVTPALAAGLLRHCTVLHTLDVSSSNIDGFGACDLAKSFVGCVNLHLLNISSNQLGSGGTCALAKGLEHCTKLTALDIRSNCIEASGAGALVESLVKCKELSLLAIGDNRLQDEGAIAIARTLHNCTELAELDISQNGITDFGAMVLMDSLKHCTNLRCLYAGFNLIYAAGAKSTAGAIKYWKELDTLHFVGNFIGVDGAKAIVLSLKEMCCPKLELFHIDSCRVGSGIVSLTRSIASFLPNCKFLCTHDSSSNFSIQIMCSPNFLYQLTTKL